MLNNPAWTMNAIAMTLTSILRRKISWMTAFLEGLSFTLFKPFEFSTIPKITTIVARTIDKEVMINVYWKPN